MSEEETQKQEELVVHIPRCCQEGWETCEHVVKEQRPTKQNIAL